MRRPSLEFLIKTLVSGLALGVTILITGTALYVDYSDRIEAEASEIAELAPLVSSLTASEASLLLAKVGTNWTVLAYSDTGREGALFKTLDGARWTVSLNRGKIFSAMLLRQRHILVVGMICLLISVEVAVFLAYSLTRPLKALAWTCREVTRGNWIHVPDRMPHSLELETLKNTFNGMVDQLGKWKTVERRVARIERLAALGQVVAGVSHEIRNPLASMRIHLDLLSESVPEEGRPSLSVIDQELDRLNATVSQLLSYARPRPPVKGPVKIRILVEWAYRMVKVQLSRKSILWEVGLSDPDLTVWGDQGQLQQMLLNLILNSIRAMEEQGGKLEIFGRQDDQDVLLLVRDTGPGIPRELAERVFDPFVTTYADGTGLGLSMVLQIVEMHGGRIELAPDIPGATFIISLPSATEGAAANHA